MSPINVLLIAAFAAFGLSLLASKILATYRLQETPWFTGAQIGLYASMIIAVVITLIKAIGFVNGVVYHDLGETIIVMVGIPLIVSVLCGMVLRRRS